MLDSAVLGGSRFGDAMLFLAPASVMAQTAETIDTTSLRVCADPNNLPFSNDKGEGFENKIAELFAADLGVPVRYTYYPDSMGFIRSTLNARRCDHHHGHGRRATNCCRTPIPTIARPTR